LRKNKSRKGAKTPRVSYYNIEKIFRHLLKQFEFYYAPTRLCVTQKDTEKI